jgi:cell division protein FtsA
MDDKNNELRKEDLIFGLDIGSSKINLFAGAMNPDNTVKILCCGALPLKRPDELDDVVETLQNVIRQLEPFIDFDVRDVYVGIAGNHVSSVNYKGLITLSTGEVREVDMERVKNLASTIPETAGQILHVFPGEYTLDEQGGIRNPKGLNGRRLGVDVQVVTSPSNVILNLDKSVTRAGLHVEELVLEPLAAASAVLTDDERELGVALIDIGAGSADIAVFVGESVRYTTSLDYAGNSITSDISKCLKVPISLAKAEDIKKRYGTCRMSNLIEDETFPVPSVGDRGDVQCSRKLLAQVITARVYEIFKRLKEDLEKQHMDGLLNGGIVLTGGCCALEGIDAVAEKVFGKSVRIGHPRDVAGVQSYSNPSYATGIGLLLYAAKQRRKEKRRETGKQISVSMKKSLQWFRDFVKTYF